MEAAAFAKSVTKSARRGSGSGGAGGAGGEGAGGAGEGEGLFDMGVVDDDLVWCGGVGTKAAVTSSSKLDANRAEVLRLIVACCAKPLYMTPEAYVEE